MICLHTVFLFSLQFVVSDLSTGCLSFSSRAFFHGLSSWVYLHGLIFTDLHSRVIIFSGDCLLFLFDGFSLPVFCIIFLTCLSAEFAPVPLASYVFLILAILPATYLLDPHNVIPDPVSDALLV